MRRRGDFPGAHDDVRRNDQGHERREAGRDMGESYRERYRGHNREAGADYELMNRAGSPRDDFQRTSQSHFGPPRGGYGHGSYAREAWRYARAPEGGMGEVGADEGYRRAYGGEDYFYTRDRGWADQRAGYGNGGPHTGKGPRGYRRGDDRIREEVCERLTDHPELDASDVEIAVVGGEVTLGGTVATRRDKRLAEDIVLGVRGIEDVHNRIRLASPAAAKAPETPRAAPRGNEGGARNGRNGQA